MSKEQWQDFLVSQALIWLPLLAGHRLRLWGWAGQKLARRLHLVNLYMIAPVVYGLGAWRLERQVPGWERIPLAMTGLLTLSTVLAAVLVPRLEKHSRQRIGTLVVMVPLSNIGHTMAGFLTLLLLSERAYAYNTLLMWPMILFLFLIWMPLGRHWGQGGQEPLWRNILRNMASPNMIPLGALIAGTALNVGEVPMGPAVSQFMRVSVFAGTAVIMFALGLQLHVRRIGPFATPLRWVYAAKFLANPVLMALMILALGLRGEMAGALVIASCVPVGVMVVAISTLYHLDVDLANAGYLWSTLLFMAIVLPLLIVVIQQPFFS